MSFKKTGIGVSLGIVDPVKPAPKKAEKPVPTKQKPVKVAPKAN